jgi:hypothetical protein
MTRPFGATAKAHGPKPRRYELPAFVESKYRRYCFTCGRRLTKHSYTREHLVPQWMIEAFELGEQRVTLRPDVTLRYLDYLTPCCRACNCGLLSRVEKNLKADLLGVRRSEEASFDDYAVWAAKIIAGALFYERILEGELPREGRFPAKYDGFPMPITPRRMLEDYFRALRGDCVVHSLSGATPFSMFVFRAKVPPRRRSGYDFLVFPYLQALYMRLRHRVVLCRVDGGYLAQYGSHFFAPFRESILAPLQCEELASHFFTMAGRQRVEPKVVREWRGKTESVQYMDLPVRQPFIEPPTSDDVIGWLARCTRSSEEAWRGNDGGALTFLRDKSGAVPDLPVNVRPMPPPKT